MKTVNRTNLPGDSLGTPRFYFAQQNGNILIIRIAFVQNASHSFVHFMLDIFMFIVLASSFPILVMLNYTQPKQKSGDQAREGKSSQQERRITYSGLDNLAWRCGLTCWLPEYLIKRNENILSRHYNSCPWPELLVSETTWL